MSGLDLDLFALVWTEIDFDEHPINGGHGMQPEGELNIIVDENCIVINDKRISVAITTSNYLAKCGTGELLVLMGEASNSDLPQHIIALTEEGEVITNGAESLQISSLPRAWIPNKLAISPYLSHLLSQPLEKLGHSAKWRDDLWAWRERFAPLLQNWTWHLEYGNKTDRLGWYIRAKGNTLFTIFIGWAWLADDASDRHGFFLFERAPLGELDRADEDEPNRLDVDRTKALFAEGGALRLLQSMLVNDNGQISGLEVISPESGLWPLVMGRGEVGSDASAAGEWFSQILDLMAEAITQVSMT